MPDITMCLSEECPIKTQCYRYRAKPSAHQSYSLFTYNKVGEKCLHFMAIFNTAKEGDPRLKRRAKW